jgi:hypothetical protein
MECGTARCRFCHYVDHEGRVTARPRALTDVDLRWWLCDAQAQLGIRSGIASSFAYREGRDGALELVFCPVGGSGTNSAERSWESERKRRAAARERCIFRRLQGADPLHVAVLTAAYSPNTLASRAERVTGDREARTALTDAFGPLLPVVPLTERARRELAPTAAVAASREVGEDGVVDVGGLQLAVTVRHRGGERFCDGVETDESLRARCIAAAGGVVPAEHAGVYSTHGWRLDWAAEELGLVRHEVHVRRWAGPDDVQDGFVLAQLARLAQGAERAKKREQTEGHRRRRGRLTRTQAEDQRARVVVERLCEEARGLVQTAHLALGIERAEDVHVPRRPPPPREERPLPVRVRPLLGMA